MKILKAVAASIKSVDVLRFDNVKNFDTDILATKFDVVPLLGKKDDDFPLPWDAGFSVKNGTMTIEGSAGPSGWGSAVVAAPAKDILESIDIELQCPENMLEELKNFLTEHGVQLK